MLVTICVITYQRPEGLDRLIQALNQLTFSRISCPEIHLVVVDNDSSGSAYEFCQQQVNFRWPFTALIESQRGISYARNRSIAAVPPDSQFIAFIDDDEVPEPNWLEELLIVQSAYSADVVQGRVAPYFLSNVPTWMSKGNFFEPRRYKTGQTLEAAYTNNLLVRSDLLKQREKVFDERFALTGGEDSYFFRTLHLQGHHFVWANDAVVYEWIPASRTTIEWIVLRAYRSCLTYTIWEQEAKPALTTKLTAAVKAIIQIAIGLFAVPVALLMGRYFFTKALLSLYQGVGRLSGLLGIRYEEYKRIHGA